MKQDKQMCKWNKPTRGHKEIKPDTKQKYIPEDYLDTWYKLGRQNPENIKSPEKINPKQEQRMETEVWESNQIFSSVKKKQANKQTKKNPSNLFQNIRDRGTSKRFNWILIF